MKESVIQQDIRLALGLRDDVMLFRINVGSFRPIDGDPRRVIQSAPTGTPDLLGVLRRPNGIGQGLAIEVKTLKGKQRVAQAHWQTAWEARGGLYILARSVEDVLKVIDAPVDIGVNAT